MRVFFFFKLSKGFASKFIFQKKNPCKNDYVVCEVFSFLIDSIFIDL
jgi:hypothetical protein